ncbi:TraR/DksA C4-type zinc finger protein [Streptomyces sp. NPDC018019]|uniref:TraR/DksA family transcriptional regulator n=1 Tax=Streptomyces sp. NPDC018019 TaxID=3365030 RepID=UPI003792328C
MVAKKTAAKKSTADAGTAAAGRPGPAARKRASAAAAMSAEAVPDAPDEAPEPPQPGPAARKTAKKAAGKTAKKAPAKKAAEEAGDPLPNGKPAAKKAAPRKAAKKTAPAEKAVPAKKTGAKTVVEKQTPGGAPTAEAEQTGRTGPVPKARTADPGELAVRPGEDPWTPEEVAEARAELDREVARLRTEIEASESALAGLMRDSGEGTGDEADTGTKNITREHEMALASNAREMLSQTERAMERLGAGTYGLCENCGKPIGKARMQAFPRATLCVECKQKQERR